MTRIGSRYGALILAGLLGLVLLAISLPGLSNRVEKHEALRGYIENLQAAEGRFRELVIGLRHGVATNYDEANAWQQRIVDINRRIAHEVSGVPILAQQFEAYRQAGLGNDGRWEDFKQRNSVVRNSLRYVQRDLPVFLRELRDTDGRDDIHESLAALNIALFSRRWARPRTGTMRSAGC
jgi:hypothetical protein